MSSRVLFLLLILLWTHPAEAQTLGTWTEFPNSAYTNSAAICGKPGAQPAPNCVPNVGQVGSAITAWVDGDYDPATGLFYVPRGGGHGDGAQNAVPAFNATQGKWVLLTPPTSNIPPFAVTSNVPRAIYPDETPSSVHSYGAVAWMAWLNRMWSAGGIFYSGAGESTPARTWWWSPVQPSTPLNAWTQKLMRPGGYGTYAVADPATKTVWIRTSADFTSYKPVLDNGTLVDIGPAPETWLTQDYKIGQTQIVVNNVAGYPTSTAPFPTVPPFKVRLQSFSTSKILVFNVTGINGLTWTGAKEGTDTDVLLCNPTTPTNCRGVQVTQVLTRPSPYTVHFAQSASGNSAKALDSQGRKIYAVANQTNGGVAVRVINLSNLALKEYTLATTGGPATFPNGAGVIWDAGRLVMLGPAPVSGKSGLWSLVPVNCGGAAPQAPCAWTQHTSPDGVYSAPSDTGHGTWKKFYRHGCDYIHIVTGTANVWKVRPPWTTDTCQAQTVTLTVTKSGTGAGAVSGGGTYTINTSATVGAAPEPGSTVGAVTGSPGCQVGPVPMDANKSCNIEFKDTQAPVVTVTTPAEGQIIKAATPIVFTVADNRPGVITTFLLDGMAMGGPVLDPTTIPEGTHQLIVQGVDAAGNSSQVTRNFISVLIPPCPVCPSPTAATLTVVTTGPGHGTVTGPSGPLAVGTPVTLTPTPAEDSLYIGVVPPSCTPTFPMPAQDLTCSFAFNLKPPPPPTFSLTTVVVGQGTVSGAGEYIEAAPVTLGGAPATGWLDQGWSPSPCAAAFPMPAQNLVCTRTYTQPPPPSGTAPIDGLIARTWKPIPYGTVLGQSKHARVAFDSKRKRMVIAGGDGTDGSGNSFTGQYVHSIDLAQSATITRHHAGCPPVGTPQLMPYKSDNVTWVYDSKRDRLLMTPAYYESPTRMLNFTALPTGWTILGELAPNLLLVSDTAGKQWAWNQTVSVANRLECSNRYVPDFAKSPYSFDPNTNLWSRSNVVPGPVGGWGGDSHNHFGVYDPVTDSTYRFFNGCGLHRVPMDGTTGPACYSFTFPNTPAGGMDPSNDQSAIDVQGRHLYVIARYKNHLLKWSLDQQKIVKYIPMPTTWRRPESEFGGGDYETHLAFDSKNRVLMIPHDMSYGSSSTGEGTLIDATTGENRGVYFFNVDTEVWEHELAPVGAKVSGNVLGYDAANNVFMYFGRSPTKQIWLYRYKD